MTNDKFLAYEKAVRQVWADGQVSLDEADMIEALRKSLNITLEEHAEIESKIRREYEKAVKEGKEFSTTPQVQDQKESAEPEKPGHSEPPPESEPEAAGGDDEPIGDLSSEELSKDLDDLSKSIGQLGERMKSRVSLSERLSKELGEDLDTEPAGGEKEVGPAPESMPDDDEGSTSELLKELRSQYKLEEEPIEGETGETEVVKESAPAEVAAPESPEPAEEPPAEEPPLEEPPLEEPPAEEPPLEEPVREEVDTLDEYLEAGKAAFRERDYKRSVIFLKKALNIDPDNKEVKFFLKKVATAVKGLKQSGAVKKPRTPAETSHEPAQEPPQVVTEDYSDIDSTVVEPKGEVSEGEITGSKTDCSSCGGSGICNWCKGAMKCYWCNGSGKCTKCQGKKEIDGKPCGFCNGEGICGSCEGTGNCTWCRGTGKCNSCSLD